ncbi:hypothetical protein D3C86_1924660 [compost metagenome]
MNMIGHQTIGIDLYAKYILEFAQIREIALIVLRDSKYHLAIMATLHHMVRMVR